MSPNNSLSVKSSLKPPEKKIHFVICPLSYWFSDWKT